MSAETVFVIVAAVAGFLIMVGVIVSEVEHQRDLHLHQRRESQARERAVFEAIARGRR